MAKFGKRTKAAREAVDAKKTYEIGEAVGIVKKNATAKFDETVEIAMNLGVDPRHSDQMVRGVVTLPNGTGRDMKVAVFAKDAKADEATAAGADRVGAFLRRAKRSARRCRSGCERNFSIRSFGDVGFDLSGRRAVYRAEPENSVFALASYTQSHGRGLFSDHRSFYDGAGCFF